MKSIHRNKKTNKNKQSTFSHTLKNSDTRFLIRYSIFALLITIVYWVNGGKSVFVFPAILCVGLVIRNLRRPMSKHFANGYRVLPIKQFKPRQ